MSLLCIEDFKPIFFILDETLFEDDRISGKLPDILYYTNQSLLGLNDSKVLDVISKCNKLCC